MREKTIVTGTIGKIELGIISLRQWNDHQIFMVRVVRTIPVSVNGIRGKHVEDLREGMLLRILVDPTGEAMAIDALDDQEDEKSSAG
jgi:hypothetical protein